MILIIYVNIWFYILINLIYILPIYIIIHYLSPKPLLVGNFDIITR